MPLDDDIRAMIEHDNANAQALTRELAAALPHSVSAQILLAISHLRRLEFPQAIAAYRKALAIDPKHNDALHSLALCLAATGDYPAAFAAYRQALAATSSALSMRVMALLSHRMGHLDQSIRLYESLLRTASPTSLEVPLAQQGLAAALRDAGRPLAADRMVQQLLDRFHREPAKSAQFGSLFVMRNGAEDFWEWSRYADKAYLARAAMRRRADDSQGRVPESFVLPDDRAALAAFAAGPDAPRLYIVKPSRSSGGQGISVTEDVAQAIVREDVVVQRYLDRPYLVDGRKSHVRVYGLIASADPLRAYIYGDGVVRFAPERYDPQPGRPGLPSMHITNTALHLDHPDMTVSQDASRDDVGMVWSLSALMRRIAADGRDAEAVFAGIKRLMEWFVRMLAADGLFERQAAAPSRAFARKLFGLDVLIDADGEAWLLEMQRLPAQTGSPLVEKINGEMFATMFQMAQGLAIEDGMDPATVARLCADPEALRARELEIETAHRGRFIPLKV